MHQRTHFTNSPNQVWSEGPLHLTMRHHCFTVNKRALSISKKQYTPTHQHTGMFITLHPRETHTGGFCCKVKLRKDVFYTFKCLQMVFTYFFVLSPFIQLLASIPIYRCYCEAALRWVECVCVCMLKSSPQMLSVNQLPSGCLTEQRSVSVWAIAPLISLKTNT